MFKGIPKMKSENWAGVFGIAADVFVLATGLRLGDTKSVVSMVSGIAADGLFWWRGQRPAVYSVACAFGVTALEVLSSSQAVAKNQPLKVTMMVQGFTWTLGLLRYPLSRMAEKADAIDPERAQKLRNVNETLKVGLAYGSMAMRPFLIAFSGEGHNLRILGFQLLAGIADGFRGKPRKEDMKAYIPSVRPLPPAKSKVAKNQL